LLYVFVYCGSGSSLSSLEAQLIPKLAAPIASTKMMMGPMYCVSFERVVSGWSYWGVKEVFLLKVLSDADVRGTCPGAVVGRADRQRHADHVHAPTRMSWRRFLLRGGLLGHTGWCLRV